MPSFQRSRGTFALSVAACAVMLVVIVISVSTFRSASANTQTQQVATATPVPVMSVLYTEAAEAESRFPALITARRESALGFPQGGQIRHLNVDVGDPVEEGQILASLDTRALEAQRQAAQADVAAARAEARLASVTLDRQRRLVAQGHVSEQVLDEVSARAEAAAARIEAASAVEAALSVQIELSALTAPYAGIVTARHFDDGASVGAGVPVLTLVEAGVLEVRAGLPAHDAARLNAGAAYRVELATGETILVRLRAATGVIDARDRSISVVFDMPEGAQTPAGSTARLVLPYQLEERGFWAPVAALSEGRRGLWSIYALVPDGEAFILEPRPVEILHTERDRVYLRGAVQTDEMILAGGVHRVAPCQQVHPARGD